jgi:hypothetical protein
MRYGEGLSSALRYCGPHLLHAVHKPATLHPYRRLSKPREMECITMTFADRVLEALLVVLAKQPANVHVVGDRNVLAANDTVVVPIIHTASSQAWHDEVVEHVAVGHGLGSVL